MYEYLKTTTVFTGRNKQNSYNFTSYFSEHGGWCIPNELLARTLENERNVIGKINLTSPNHVIIITYELNSDFSP